MRKYTQKVDAIQFTGTFESLKKIFKEFNIEDRTMIEIEDFGTGISRIIINYHETEYNAEGLYVNKDDYLVKDAKGNLKKFDKDDFETLFK